MEYNKKITIIGLSGKLGSGKDTCAKIIQQDFAEYNFRIKHFASGVRAIYDVLFPFDKIPEEYTQEWKSKYNPLFDVTRRAILQGIGEGLRQHVHEDLWAKLLFYDTAKYGHNIIIPDVRYKNEVELIKKFGGYVFRVVRKQNPYPQTDHISNCDLDYEELPIIANTGNLETLRSQTALSVLRAIRK
jgi:hypothetical protein